MTAVPEAGMMDGWAPAHVAGRRSHSGLALRASPSEGPVLVLMLCVVTSMKLLITLSLNVCFVPEVWWVDEARV